MRGLVLLSRTSGTIRVTLIATIYEGKATDGKFHAVTAVKADNPLTKPPTYANRVSVCGLRHSLKIVGTVPRALVPIESPMASDGSDVMAQRTSARKAKAPHA